jgi:hypothetical protein
MALRNGACSRILFDRLHAVGAEQTGSARVLRLQDGVRGTWL